MHIRGDRWREVPLHKNIWLQNLKKEIDAPENVLWKGLQHAKDSTKAETIKEHAEKR